ncbi:hypothetical protein CAPTEDRAFT_224615 [Capitella teleta]|uniref:Octanoyl-[acyl-carrier-protein]:protein N-octanoyltransferase LIPT2, mitochondrial n=1 Tax=Capitella teleta TaxID=283909 RepID=R7V6C9_CAPTE|nr:hypothetical protein CAPTEDRAFT_224615 [Capitella teleta]|eukprot:ELU14124.1 hypothetical protein CAPTEDRAFT_224615 [Capitella teleta]
MATLKNLVRVVNLGLKDYHSALRVQREHSSAILRALSSKEPRPFGTLLLVEHPPVYTVGLRDKVYSTEEENSLKDLGADFVRTNRGGLITFHGPGQLVFYPIIYLKDFNIGMRQYVDQLEETVIQMCRHYGIEANRSPDTGVWVKGNKLAAIGVHGSRYVTTHGVGLNCSTDLSWFEHIVPCGIEGKGVTSLSEELSSHISVNDAVPHLLKAFADVFQCTYASYEDR